MVEIYNLDRSECYGRFDHFKTAKPQLCQRLKRGEISGAVLVESYKGALLQRSYVATYDDGWRVPATPKTSAPQPQSRRQTRQAPKISARGLQRRAERYFQAGQPDWLTGKMPVFL